MRKAGPSLTLAALALVGCGDGNGAVGAGFHPVRGCEHIDHAPCDVREMLCQERLFQLATCLRGEAAGELPPIAVVSEADFGASLAAEQAARPPDPTLATREWALSSLGLIAPDALEPATVTSEYTKAIGGVYHNSTKNIVIVDHGGKRDDQAGSVVLVHEMIHALQDREIDLTKMGRDVLSRDARFAVTALIEGEARMHETRYSAAIAGYDVDDADLMKHFSNAVSLDQERLLEDPSPLTKSYLRFPYEWGARYVFSVWKAGAMGAVHARLLAPPMTTRVLMASVVDALEPEPAPPRPSQPTAPADWTAIEFDTLGAWTVFLALAIHAPTEVAEAESLALAWRNDGLWLYERSTPGTGTALVWRIELADESSASRLAARMPNAVGQSGSIVIIAKTSDGPLVDWTF